jgi:hypothetical protein
VVIHQGLVGRGPLPLGPWRSRRDQTRGARGSSPFSSEVTVRRGTAYLNASKPSLLGPMSHAGPIAPALEWVHEDAVGSAAQQPFEIGLAHRERQVAEIVTVNGEHIEGAELHLVAMLPGVLPVVGRHNSYWGHGAEIMP